MKFYILSITAIDLWNERNGTNIRAENLTDEQFVEINRKYDQRSYDSVEDLLRALNEDTGIDTTHDYIRAVEGPKTFFPVTAVSRDDLEAKGFDVTGVTDAQMERIASKMADDYLEQLYWTSLDIIAEAEGVPRRPQTAER